MTDIEVEAVFDADGAMMLRDSATNVVYSAEERDDNDNMIRIGTWSDGAAYDYLGHSVALSAATRAKTRPAPFDHCIRAHTAAPAKNSASPPGNINATKGSSQA